MKNELVKKIGKTAVLPLAFTTLVGGCGGPFLPLAGMAIISAYAANTIDSIVKIPSKEFDLAYDFMEKTSEGDFVAYNTFPNLSEKPKDFELRHLFLNGNEYFKRDSIWDAYENRIHKIVDRGYVLEDSLKCAEKVKKESDALRILKSLR